MPRTRLFADSPLLTGQELVLTGEQANYAGRVLRCRVGDLLCLFDGSGKEFAATVQSVGRHRVLLDVGAATTPGVESPLRTRLVQGVSRGDRMDTVVQKATELGVQRITPLLSEFSVVKLDAARAQKRRHHWQGIAQSACEQCGRTRLPRIDAVAGFADLLAERSAAGTCRLLLDPGARQPLTAVPVPPDDIDILIGPEGGFSDNEREQAINAGYQPVRLGPRVLRTETAAIATLALVQSLWGDMGGN